MKTTNPQPPHLTPGWFPAFFARHLAREAYFRDLGSDPDHCPDYADFRREKIKALSTAIEPITTEALEQALEWRERLGIIGRATEADAWRMLELSPVTIERCRYQSAWVDRRKDGGFWMSLPEHEPADCPLEEIVSRLAGYMFCLKIPALEAWPIELPVNSALGDLREQIAMVFDRVWLTGEVAL